MSRPICVVLVLVVSGLLSIVASPAWACGCGAYIPDRAGASVVDERAVIAWDGTTQDILMSFDVGGRSDKAAWVMPVPSAAHVALGDAQVFDELRRLTAPRVEYRDSWWPTFTWLLPRAMAPETAGAPRWRSRRRARQSENWSVRRHSAGRQRPDSFGNMVGRQRVSASGRPGPKPRTICRRPMGNRRGPVGSRRSRRVADRHWPRVLWRSSWCWPDVRATSPLDLNEQHPRVCRCCDETCCDRSSYLKSVRAARS